MLARFKQFGLAFFMAAALCLSMIGFSGVASASSHPTLECTPKTVFPNPSGQGFVGLNGEHYTPFGFVVIQPQNQPSTGTIADAGGNFSFTDVLFSFNQGRTLEITAVDQTTSESATCSVFFV